jgi:hypothetical protein
MTNNNPANHLNGSYSNYLAKNQEIMRNPMNSSFNQTQSSYRLQNINSTPNSTSSIALKFNNQQLCQFFNTINSKHMSEVLNIATNTPNLFDQNMVSTSTSYGGNSSYLNQSNTTASSSSFNTSINNNNGPVSPSPTPNGNNSMINSSSNHHILFPIQPNSINDSGNLSFNESYHYLQPVVPVHLNSHQHQFNPNQYNIQNRAQLMHNFQAHHSFNQSVVAPALSQAYYAAQAPNSRQAYYA